MATLKDIATKTNISSGAVSRILNNDSTLNVSKETKQLVLDTAKEMGYQKKIRRGINEKNFVFGILQWYSMEQEVDDPYYLYVRLGAENYCSTRGIKVIRAFKSDMDFETTLANVDCLICIGKFHTEEIKVFKQICKTFILVDMHTQKLDCNSIIVDMPQAIEDALNYLVQLGHTHIGYLGGKEYLKDNVLYFDRRKVVFENFCRQNNICYKDYMREDMFHSDSGYAMMKEMILSGKCPTAFFAASDSIAIGAMRAINDAGFNVPNDFSIIGFNNIQTARFTAPPLTTIAAPAKELGEYAARFLESILEHNSPYDLPIRFVLPCELIERSSCGKPRTSLDLF